ncbi:MAG: hypothetical protein ABIG39_04320 [Candidatus Micrarchaeota archaeon]
MGLSTRRGLFFGVSVALLVALMFVSMGIWAATIKTREVGDAEKFKLMSLRSIDASVSEEQLREVMGAMGHRAVYYLDWHIRYSGEYSTDVAKDLEDMLSMGRCRPIDINMDGRTDLTKDEFLSFASECLGGSGSGVCREFDINADGDVNVIDAECFVAPGESVDSFAYLSRAIADSAKERGFDFSMNIRDVGVSQTDPWAMQLKLKVDVRIDDIGERIGTRKTRAIETLVGLEGLEDPLVGVESWKHDELERPGLKRRLLPSNGTVAHETGEKGDVVRGKGWVYGEITDIGGLDDVDKRHILRVEGNAERIVGIADRYAGVIVETSPEVSAAQMRIVNSTPTCMAICDYHVYEEVSNCLDCMRWTPTECEPGSQVIGNLPCPHVSPPYILELTGRNQIHVPFASGIRIGGSEALLINSPSDDALEAFSRAENNTNITLWELGGLRSLALCGGYVETTNAPDFLQRLRGETYSKSENGLESLVYFGSGGTNPSPVSAVDYMHYRGENGIAVKGMPGCRNGIECVGKWPENVFALDEMRWEDYGVGEILCGNQTVPC